MMLASIAVPVGYIMIFIKKRKKMVDSNKKKMVDNNEECTKKCCIQTFVMCIQVIAAGMFFIGDNSKDILEHAKNWKCNGKCPKLLEGFALVFLIISYLAFQITPSVLDSCKDFLKKMLNWGKSVCESKNKKNERAKASRSDSQNHSGNIQEQKINSVYPQRKVKTHDHPGLLLLPSFINFDIIYTGISIYAKKTDSCSLGIALIVAVGVVGTVSMIISGMRDWREKEISHRDGCFIIIFLGLAGPFLALYLLADNIEPLNCAKLTDKNRSIIRIVFSILAASYIFSYQCTYLYLKYCKGHCDQKHTDEDKEKLIK